VLKTAALRAALTLSMVPLVLALSCAGVPKQARILEPSAWNGTPEVRTRFGVVRGFGDADGTWVWKAIPFAAPPTGELRWRAPRDPAPWDGIRAARAFNPGCTQFNPLVGGIRGSEDCLALNVWRPKSAECDLPVYVWIHGGGNSIGSATMVHEYGGSRIARASNVIFVSLNYRLGPFGWFSHPALREGSSPEDDSGNYGTLDIIQALRWIQDNIAAFGGDPRNVAITGESSGGMNVLSMMLSPLSKGLFGCAVSQSAAAGTCEPAEGEQLAERVLHQLLVNDRKARTTEQAEAVAGGMSAEAVRTYLRSKSDRDLIRCFAGSATGMTDNPAIFRDGHVIPAAGLDAFSTGEYPNKVPLIIGSNREELKLFLAFDRTRSWKSELSQAVARYGSMRWKATGVDGVARRVRGRGDAAPVYVYEFAWGAPDAKGESPMPGSWGRRLGAFHSLEIPFFLGHDTVDAVLHLALFTAGNRPGRKALSSAMMDYVASFIRTGDPNRPGSGLPRWLPWSNEPGAPKGIVFDADRRAPRIGMTSVEVTVDGVFAAIDSDLPASLAAKTRENLARSHSAPDLR
jgi:para-nitrobenzyl esterase